MRPKALLAAALLVGLIPASLGAQSLSSGSSASPATLSEPVLQPGDFVQIAVWRKPELSGEFAIRADGTIADPFYSTVQAGGVPLSTVIERVVAHVERFEANPWVTVVPLLRVAVRGEVRQPNLYTLSPETTALQALMLAGGPTERGDLRRIRLLRDGQEIGVDLARIDGTAQQTVRSGDQIVVQRRRQVFRDFIAPAASVTGAVVAIINLVTR
jgi:polysaccharide biosynthesis/export protein